MSKSTITIGQTGAILQMFAEKNVPAAQLQAIIDKGLLADLLDGNIEKIKRDDFRALLELSSLSVLTLRTPHNIGPLDDTLDLAAFYRSRPGLRVWDDFVSAILAPARISKKKPALKKVYSRDLTADAQDDVIERGLGKNHYFEEKEVALLVAKMIANQEGGIAGALLNNGKENLFYTKGCVVYVLWGSRRSELARVRVPAWWLRVECWLSRLLSELIFIHYSVRRILGLCDTLLLSPRIFYYSCYTWYEIWRCLGHGLVMEILDMNVSEFSSVTAQGKRVHLILKNYLLVRI